MDDKQRVQKIVKNIKSREKAKSNKAQNGSSSDLQGGGQQDTKKEDDAEFFECSPDQPSDDTRYDKPTGRSDSKQGGDKAVTEVVAKQDVANPRRAIVVKWEPPKQPPQGYRLILYDLGNENKPLKEEVNPIEASRKTHRFVELKTETQYCVCVCPIYNGNTSEGTLSNVIITEKRINLANEQESGFGQTEKIIHAVKSASIDLTAIELSWSSVQMGENYKVTGYEVWIYQKGWILNTTILKKNVGPKITSVEVNLKNGQKFEVKVSTLHLDLDTGKIEETSKNYGIFTDPSKTTINDCELAKGVVHFSWQSVNGAKKYQLIMKDEYVNENLVPDVFCDVPELGKGCSTKVQLSGELQIGRTCMTKVIVHAEGGGTSETDWKPHLIGLYIFHTYVASSHKLHEFTGGEEVPRNVKAARSSENPTRAANVTFDWPRKGQAPEYKIVVIPESGMKKSVCCKTSNVVVEYLRKGISYQFEVYAKWGANWSKGSPSNSVRMDGDKCKTLMDIHNIKNTNVDLSNAILAGQFTEVNLNLGKDFGQVEELRAEARRARDKDTITLRWNSPSFNKKICDFKVEIYKVEVWKQHESERWAETIYFEKNRSEYQSKEFELDLGETYMFAISTIYLDIDQDYIFKSIAVPGQFHTRPCAPRCIRNDCIDDTLTIEWNAAKGAQRYQLEVYADNGSDATFRQDMEKNTIYQRKFDETFGYGSTYYVVIKSFGVDNIPNSSQTSKKIIGGDRVAANVTVTSNHPRVTDRNSEVFLSWTAPNRAPKRYDISSFPTAETMKTNITGEECLVSGLKAGTEYYFKVKAVHEQNGKEKLSGGSTSKRIRINPTPTQVNKVWAGPGKNPSTSVEISWEKVDAEKENETTKYRVCLTNEYETTKRELIDVEVENITLQGLEPGSKYFVTVAGANCMGYGIDSKKIQFQTDLGSPKNVHVLNNMENLSTSIILEFSNAEGRVIKYIATLHKCRNQIYQPMSGPREVKSGHIYNDLEPNTEYLVKLQAVFASGKGKVVQSRKVMTAPSKTKIIESGRTVQNEQSSSREIYAEWSSDLGCNYHEVKVIYGTSTVESRLFKENNENKLKYLCLNAATQYSVQVRSRNDSGHFGDWSDEALIYLAPAKLHQVFAELGENGHDIFVRCRAALAHSIFYFMRALCGNEPAGKPIQAQEENDIVKWKFTPPESAQRYIFELWAEDSGRIKGKRVLSNSVISRPQKFTFTMVRTFLSTDIEMAWEKQERCDLYEITICARDQERPENIVRTAETSCWYRCKSPGNTYLVSIRAIRELVKGEWSDHPQVTLAPGKIHLLEPTEAKNEAVKTIKIEWKPLDITPEGYLVNLFCNGKEVDTIKTKTTKHVFEKKLKPGSLCYCTVAAFNDDSRTLMGKASKSRIYRIEWAKASYFSIIADENEPPQRVKMNWDKPSGVNCFKLEIENNQTGVVTTTCLTDERYVFESGIPSNTYSVRLHCGCDDRYDVNYIQQTLTMKPKPPTDIRVYANDQVKGLIIEFKDTPSIRKHYEITAQGLTDSTPKIRKKTSQRSLKLCGLVPGESYKVSVSTIIGESRSIEATSEGYISTFPDGVRNLRSKMDNGIILFEWDALEIKPSKYIVEWRVDNEPITEEHTQEPSMKIDILKPVEYYRVRVKAANSSGVGSMSEWKNHPTGSGVLAPPDGSQTQTKPSSSIQDKPREQSDEAYSGDQYAQKRKIINPVNLKVIKHEDMEIWYDPDKPLRFESNVFPAKREGADGAEELVLKIIPGITETNKREVKNLKMVMRHENIVKYYASGFCEFRGRDAIYLLMEKCDHDTVWERFYSEKQLKNGMRRKPVAYTRCKFEMRSTGEGIQYIHERRIVHRDLKPHNILIRDGVLVISDFGLSKRLPNSKSITSQSQTDIGTNGWRAPETGDDNAKTTKASDVYSFGLVSYYMLTNGKHPYGGDPHKWHTYIVDDVDGSKMCLDGLDSLPDAQLSKDLIKSMLVRKLEQRPTIAEVLSHPFFWDDRRKFEFISDVCKYLELVTTMKRKEADTDQVSLMLYRSLDGNDGKYAEKVDMTNWKEKILLEEGELQELRNKAGVLNEEDIQEDSIQKKIKKKARDCVSDAIKFIRNRYDHEDKSENIDMTNEELWEFYNKRFPYLFLFVYHKIKVYFTGKSRDDKDFTSTMARYFVH